MADNYISAAELEKFVNDLPSNYGAWSDGHLEMICPDDPRYDEAKKAYEKNMKRFASGR